MEQITVCLTVDVDSVASWLAMYHGSTSVGDISRGIFSVRVGLPRILRLFEEQGVKATWFFPGHTAESFPEEVKRVLEKGHEVCPHGYSHENPAMLDEKKERKVVERATRVIQKISGKKPMGYRTPWWEHSKNTIKILLEVGYVYDSSLMEEEFHPYFLRIGDEWAEVDYSKDPDEWMKPFVFGKPSKLLEIPPSWYLEDLTPQLFARHLLPGYGWVSADVVYTLWKEHFDYLVEKEGSGVLTITIHPEASGRPQGLKRLEEFLNYVKRNTSAKFSTLKEVALEFNKNAKFPD